jgi:hypothetical protein
MTPRLDVEVKLRQIGNLTGQNFTMQPVAPDPELKGVNLGTIPSKVAPGTVFDRLQHEMGDIKINGKKLWESYKDVLDFNETNRSKSDGRTLSTGNRTEKGDLSKVIMDIHNKYKQAAWSVVKAQELSAHNPDMEQNIQQSRQIRVNAHNPALDKTPNPVLGLTITK